MGFRVMWLPTEADKAAYFERLGIAPETLPQRLYTGPFTGRPARRYVALNVPIGNYGPTTTFVYIDAGARHRTPHERLRAVDEIPVAAPSCPGRARLPGAALHDPPCLVSCAPRCRQVMGSWGRRRPAVGCGEASWDIGE